MALIKKDARIPKREKNSPGLTVIGTQKPKIILEDHGSLIRKYGRYYIRQEMGTHQTELIDFPISDKEAKDIMSDGADLPTLFRAVRNRMPMVSLEESVNMCLLDYMQNECHMSQKLAKENISKLDRHEDIKHELHETIMHGEFPINSGITACEYKAKDLFKKENLTILGAYNYLIYLHENGEKALADLKAGLPRK